MSDKERYGERDLVYSSWHRWDSTARFLPKFEAWQLGMIDIDDCEYCRWCNEPLALIELAQDVGQGHKTATVTGNLAEMADIPAYVVLYTVEADDITQFQITSINSPEYEATVMEPPEYAEFLYSFREKHTCKKDGE